MKPLFTFYLCVSQRYYDEYVHGPQSQADIRKNTAVYERMGLPGCIGSTDVVHFRWDMCPSDLSNVCRGKEQYPSLAYQFTTDHHKKIMSVTQGHYGSHGDKTIVKFDQFIADLHHKTRYSDVRFTLYKEDGTTVEEAGAWVICDGGEWLLHYSFPPSTDVYLHLGFVKWRVLQSFQAVQSSE